MGADAVSLGATKNGAMGVEAVVFLRPGLAPGFPFLRKQSMQLASKMRFMSAQLLALLEGELWRANAAHANAMAQRLEAAVRDVPGVRITQPVEANGVFAVLPAGIAPGLAREWPFYVWDEATGEVRWMCAWDTRPADVDAFAAAVRAACAGTAPAAA